MEVLFEYVRGILIFVLFLRVLSMLFPDDSYGKYIRPVGMLFLAVMTVRPVLCRRWDPDALAEGIERAVRLPEEEEEQMSFLSEERYETAVLTQYREGLEKQMIQYVQNEGYEVRQVLFELSEEEASFGAIRSLTAVLQRQKDKQKEESSRINVLIGREPGERQERVKSAEELSVRDKLCSFYRLEQEQVDVTIVGDG